MCHSIQADDELICFVGENVFNSDLLANFIHDQTGLPCCSVFLDLFKTAVDQFNHQTILIFLNCTGVGEPHLRSILRNVPTAPNQRHLTVLDQMNPEWDFAHLALDLGVRGILYNHQELEIYPKAIRAILRGELWYPRKVLDERLLANHSRFCSQSKKMSQGLTLREKEILTLVVSGISNQEISRQLYISQHTVKTHVYNIYKKINVSSRLQAALWVENNYR